MTFSEAASIPVIFCTAYYCLVTVAHLQRGESILIHAAAGGVGQAAIMIAQMIGAEIYATVGNDQKKEHLVTTYGLLTDQIFSSRNPHFGDQIRRATDERGVDVVLNSLGGDHLRASWESLAHFGRFVEIGKRDIDRNTYLNMAPFSKSVTITSVDLEQIRDRQPALVQSLLTTVIDLFQSGKLKAVTPTIVRPIDELESVLHALQGGKIVGKAVIEPQSDQNFQVS